MDKIKLSDNKMRKIDKNVKVLRNPHTGRMVKSTSKLGKQILLEQSKFNQSGGGSHIKRDDIPKLKCVVYINDVLSKEVGILDLGSESTPELSNEALKNFSLAGILTTEEEKQDFDKLIAEHEAHEAEMKKKADAGLIVHSKHAFECEAVENAANPLGGCRNKHPPHDYHFQPYVGAAETKKVEKEEDTREVTKSRVRNIYQE